VRSKVTWVFQRGFLKGKITVDDISVTKTAADKYLRVRGNV
jgi:hypothetical protein